MVAKAETIKATLAQTRKRRKDQVCKVYEIKVDRSRLSPAMVFSLAQLFREAKWFWNAALSCESLFDFDPGVKEVVVKIGDTYEIRPFQILSSQIKQALHDRMKRAVRTLATLKARGFKVGALKFRSFLNCIPLKQFGNTYRILGKYRIRIQNLPEPMFVHGLKQLLGAEIANANLARRGADYFLMLTTFRDKSEEPSEQPFGNVGIDFNVGAGHQLVLHNGVAIGFDVKPHEDPQIKNAQRKLTRMDRTNKKLGRSKYTKNRSKAQCKIQTLHCRVTNKKKEIRNQICSCLKRTFRKICFQKESIVGWQRLWGKRIAGTALAGIIRRLHTSSAVEVTDRFVATTQTCHVCDCRTKVPLGVEWWTCPHCDTRHNRHINAGINVLPRLERPSTSVESSSSATSLLEAMSKFASFGVRVRLLVETETSLS